MVVTRPTSIVGFYPALSAIDRLHALCPELTLFWSTSAVLPALPNHNEGGWDSDECAEDREDSLRGVRHGRTEGSRLMLQGHGRRPAKCEIEPLWLARLIIMIEERDTAERHSLAERGIYCGSEM